MEAQKNGIFSHHEPIQRYLAYLDTWVLYVTGQIRFDSTVFKGKIKYAVTYKLLARLQISVCTARTRRSPLGDCIIELCKSKAGFITLHSIQKKKK